MSLFRTHLLALALFVQFVNTDGAYVNSVYAQAYAKTASKSFSYEDLVTLIKTQNLKSVNEVIPKLPKNLRQSFTLMYDSKSLQKSTPENPRAILFGDDAKLIITFGGDPTVPASKNLEILEFKDKTKTFSLHEVAFEDSLPHFATPEEIKNKCTSCHGTRPRPIWERTYPNWKGAYGENDDIVTSVNDKRTHLLQESDFVSFRAHAGQSPAFKSLFEGHEKDRVWPYSQTFADRVTATMPNYRLNLLLTILSGQQLGTQVINSKLFPYFKYTLLNRYYCSENQLIEGPDDILAKYADIPAEENWQDTHEKWRQTLVNSALLRAFDVPYGSTGLFLDRVTYTQASSTGLTPFGDFGPLVYSDNFLYSYLAQQLAAKDPFLARKYEGTFSYTTFKKDSYKDPIFAGFGKALKNFNLSDFFKAPCKYLNSRSQSELRSFNPRKVPLGSTNQTQATIRESQDIEDGPTATYGRTLVNTAGCISCHSSGSAPNIAFAIPQLFKAQNDHSIQFDGISLLDKVRIRISSHESAERMPLGGRPLTATEQESLLMYLKSITQGP